MVALITWSRVDTVSLMYMVVDHDIGSMFPLTCFHHYLLILAMFISCFLRAHTSFMLSSGWTSFPPQVPLGKGRIVFPWLCSTLIGRHPLEDSAFLLGIVLSPTTG